VTLDTPLTVVRSMKNSFGMAGITKPFVVSPSSTRAHGHGAIETSRSASAYGSESSTNAGIAAYAVKSTSPNVAAGLYSL
jgi:hypothetical protein